ncbi:MAG: hypothetical protein ACRDM9_13790, partial [Gaiellaceae bacterium]
LARARPLVVVVDDVHWAEPALLDLLLDVAARLRDVPVLIVLAMRPDPFQERPAWADRLGRGAVLRLGPLSAVASRALLVAIAGGRLEQQEERRIADTAGGNPLFLEQLVAFVGDRHSTDHLPPTIHALLAARLDQLDTAERNVLERGSVEGQVFHRGAVVALAPEETRVDGRLVALVRKDLVRPELPVIADDEAYGFRHLLIRDTAYEALPKAVRAVLHERFAAWLELHSAELVESDELVGYHLERAYRYESSSARWTRRRTSSPSAQPSICSSVANGRALAVTTTRHVHCSDGRSSSCRPTARPGARPRSSSP